MGAGAIAMRLLEEFGVKLHSHVISIGGVWANTPDTHDAIDWDAVEESPVRCADPDATPKMIAEVDAARDAGDTVGGTVEVIADNVPIGLGYPYPVGQENRWPDRPGPHVPSTRSRTFPSAQAGRW